MQASRQLKDKIFQRDGYKCAYCFQVYEPSLLHVDHIHPRVKGGSELPTNLVTSCIQCNSKKKAKVLKNPPVVADIKLEEGDMVTLFKYPVVSVRVRDDLWNELKKLKNESGKNWNGFIKELNELWEKHKDEL